jgi:hypothetical protein
MTHRDSTGKGAQSTQRPTAAIALVEGPPHRTARSSWRAEARKTLLLLPDALSDRAADLPYL